MISDLAGARVVVMGLGRFGGGLGATRWAAAHDAADVLVTDRGSAATLGEPLAQLEELVSRGRVRLRLGEHREEDFAAADVVIVNPAVPVPWDNPFLGVATRCGARLATEITLLVEHLDRRRVIGVTGTAGKSTTAAMIHHVLDRGGVTSHLGGNFGGSLLDRVRRIGPDDRVVLELSSAMLYWLGVAPGCPGWSPGVAVLTNVAPNHLDWHGDETHYRECKAAIFLHQRTGDQAIRPGTTAVAPAELSLAGEHNRANAALALAAVAAATGQTPPADALRHFPGLPHRLEAVGERRGVRFVNDSKSTTPQSTRLAVDAFDDPARVHLIAGGYDKQIDLKPMAELASRLGGFYAIGATAPRLAEIGGAPVEPCGTLEHAVQCALSRAEPGDVVLLSPGCASWDQFENFEVRGDAFRRLVRG